MQVSLFLKTTDKFECMNIISIICIQVKLYYFFIKGLSDQHFFTMSSNVSSVQIHTEKLCFPPECEDGSF